ncbi:MAG: hypothetical protein FWD61_16560 [Phycisphaerales bacterium]|nr:hypothetical protein [Phycisphaerales bacterium]
MSLQVLHLLDVSAPLDAFDLLAVLLANFPPGMHRLAALGHHSTKKMAALAGIAPASITFLPSAGWADPSGGRAVGRICRAFQPTHVHAWGVSAAIALAASRFPGKRIATLADLPSPQHLRLLHLVNWRGPNRFTWTATLPSLRERLGLPSVLLTPLAIGGGLTIASAEVDEVAVLKNTLGISPEEGPIVLLGGEGPRARHDLGLWVAGIMQHLLPRLRTIVREDPRGRYDAGLERLFYSLADSDMPILAPPDIPWRKLVQVADAMLVTAESPVPAGSILAAIAAGVPVAAGPTPTVLDLLQHNVSALIAPSFKPREISAQLETLLSTPSLGQSIATAARARYACNTGTVLDAYNALYATALPTEVTR